MPFTNHAHSKVDQRNKLCAKRQKNIQQYQTCTLYTGLLCTLYSSLSFVCRSMGSARSRKKNKFIACGHDLCASSAKNIETMFIRYALDESFQISITVKHCAFLKQKLITISPPTNMFKCRLDRDIDCCGPSEQKISLIIVR